MLGTHSARFVRASNQYATLTDAAQVNLDLSGDFTLELWVKMASIVGNGERYVPVSKWNATGNQRSYIPFNWRQDASIVRTYLTFSDDGTNAQDSICYLYPRANFWHHWAVTFDASEALADQFKVYFDSIELAYITPDTDFSATSIYNSTAPFEVGGSSTLGSNYALNGWIADIRIWDHVRSQEQILAGMESYASPAASGLLCNYTLNNTWADATGNNPDLTPINGAVFDADPAGFATLDGAILQLTAPDSTAPAISNITPASGGALAADYRTARQTPIQFDVTDLSPGLAAVLITVKYEGQSQTIVAYDGTNFLEPFGSSANTKTAISNGYTFTLLPRGGWPRGIEQMFVYAVDSAGNVEALPT